MGDGFQTFLCLLFLVFFSNILSLSNAYSFKVGGKDGWTLNPSENYNTWSKRQRFIINDTLTFKYPKGSDSVLAVTKDDYDNCNINNPFTKMDDGDSIFKLDRSGPFYFITGNKSNCDQGQKLALVVISLRGQPKPKPNPNPNPPLASPLASPVSTSPPPASSPPSPPPVITPVSSPPSTGISATPATTPASSPTSPEIPATPSTGSEAPETSALGPSGPPVAPPPVSFAAAFTPSVVFVASVPLVMALCSFAATC